MSDLAALMNGSGGGGGFMPDPRYAMLDDTAPVPMAGVFTAAGPMAKPAPKPDAPVSEPVDPVAEAAAAAYARGHAEGRAEAGAEAMADLATLEKLALGFTRLDAAMAESFRQRLFDTVSALCEACLAPLALDAKALAARVARAVDMFQRADDERVIRLHPDDLALIRPLLPEDWELSPDPALARGNIRVETASGGVEDGPEQWRLAIAEALDPATGK